MSFGEVFKESQEYSGRGSSYILALVIENIEWPRVGLLEKSLEHRLSKAVWLYTVK